MYLRNSQASRVLPIARRADDADEPGPTFPGGGVEEVLELAELLVAADEGGLERVAPVAPADLGHDPDGPPGGNGHGLALEQQLTGRLEHDGPGGRAVGRLADEDGPGLGDRLQPAGGVHEVAGDHALVGRAEGDRGLAGQDPGARLDGWAQRPDRVDQLQGGAHRPFGVVLVGGGCTPHGHDRIADELLDRPAVAADHPSGEVEVPGQELSGVLRVAALRDRREADEVGEEDRDETTLGDGVPGTQRRPTATDGSRG